MAPGINGSGGNGRDAGPVRHHASRKPFGNALLGGRDLAPCQARGGRSKDGCGRLADRAGVGPQTKAENPLTVHGQADFEHRPTALRTGTAP